MTANEVTNNEKLGRYELVVDGVTAFTEYRIDGRRAIFPHTVVPPEIGGRGVGGVLVNAALYDVEAKGLTVVPECSFVARAMEKRAARGR